ncbi:MAG: hypothetical protein COW89_06645 [Nitrospinae bacterium CG22_combo_CG10-13_8_21_14_all_47_10]|nr:MAG: hypothetical protein COW89_06645 [Nitrospinae bacterium CG22_combo_CG10-13_8_21_14_all_47_10]
MGEQGQTDGRFIEGDSDTVIDAAKRLVWLKKDTWQLAGKWMNQLQVKEFAETMNRKRFAGFSNWRLPTANEAQSLFDKTQQNSDHMGQVVYLSGLFQPGCGFLCWTGDVRHKVQGVRLSFRKGVIMYDDIYRVSRGASRLVRDIEKHEDLD